MQTFYRLKMEVTFVKQFSTLILHFKHIYSTAVENVYNMLAHW